MPAVMGILNVTPDSFSDGGLHFERSKAVHAALQMESDGAAVIDIGGESTRPGAAEINAGTEMERVIPVIEQIRRRSVVTISIDTTKAAVADAALHAGATIINDISALRFDSEMTGVALKREATVILMHMRGNPRNMQQLAQYDDVVEDVIRELSEARNAAIAAGIAADRILVDPGIGFAKNGEQNLRILARVARFASVAPVVIGASRKAFVGHITGREAGPARAIGSLAAVAAAAAGGAAMVRVHDVRETIDFLAVLGAIAEHA
jgi:dihydropteroate synthase